MGTIREILMHNLKELRGSRTMAELAELAGIPYRTYQDIEGGERWPRLDNIEAISHALGVHPTRLFKSENQAPKPEEALQIVAKALHHQREKPSTDPRISGLLSAIEKDPDLFAGVLQFVDAFSSSDDQGGSATLKKTIR